MLRSCTSNTASSELFYFDFAASIFHQSDKPKLGLACLASATAARTAATFAIRMSASTGFTNSRMVSYRRQGRNVIYRLQDHHILNLYRDVSEHLDEPRDEPRNEPSRG